jgi:hypothetical protein
MCKLRAIQVLTLLSMLAGPGIAAADEYYEVIHYKCEGPRVVVWAEGLWNEQGRNFTWFDGPRAGAYNPNDLVLGEPSRDRVIRKRCQVSRIGAFEVTISPGAKCQGQIVAAVDISWNDRPIFSARDFGSNCANLKTPYFVEADGTSRRITIGLPSEKPSEFDGRPLRFTFSFPQSREATEPSNPTVEPDARKKRARGSP